MPSPAFQNRKRLNGSGTRDTTNCRRQRSAALLPSAGYLAVHERQAEVIQPGSERADGLAQDRSQRAGAVAGRFDRVVNRPELRLEDAEDEFEQQGILRP